MNKNNLQEVLKQYEDSSNRNWSLTITRNIWKNMVIGNQYIMYDSSSRTWKELDAIYGNEESSNREVYNIVRPHRNIYASILLDPKPTPVATPKYYRGDDVYKLRKTNELIEMIKDVNDYDKLYTSLVYDMIDKGNAATKVIVSPNAGRLIKKYNTKDVVESPEFATLPESEQQRVLTALNAIADGNGVVATREDMIKIAHVIPERIHVENPHLRDIDNNLYIFDTYSLSLETAKQLYPQLGNKLGETSIDGATGQERKSAVLYNGGTNRADWQGVFVIEKWTKPCKEYPSGWLQIVVAKSEIVYEGPWPFLFVKKDGSYGYPIRLVGANNKPDTLWQDPLLYDLIPIQRRVNALRNRQIEFMTNMTYPTLLLQANSLAPGTDLRPGPNKVIVYKAGKPPALMQQGAMPGDLWNEATTLYSREMPQITGISSMRLTGEGKSGLRTAEMANKSLETDLYTLKQPADALAQLMKETMECAIAAFESTLKPGEIRPLHDNDVVSGITLNDIIHEVHIENINELSMTQEAIREEKAQMTNLIIQLNEAGFQPSYIKELLKQQKFKTSIEDLPIIGQADYDKADRENIKLMNLTPVQVMLELDNHQVHLELHTNFIKSQDYEMFLARIPENLREMVINNFNNHITRHQQEATKQQAAAQLQQAMMEAQAKGGKQ